MHTGPMSSLDGDFSEKKLAEGAKCPKCKEGPIYYQVWESHCGGYEDYYYTCEACKYDWWVDGIDS